MFIAPDKLKFNKGMTVVEVLVAILLLSVALTPALYGAMSALTVASNIRDNLVAANLAQEGMEAVRAMRDANWFSGAAFNAGLSDGIYQVGWDSTSLSSNADAYLLLDSAGIYNYSSGTPTPFKRKITISNSLNKVHVTSRVDWVVRGVNKNVTVEGRLFDWIQ